MKWRQETYGFLEVWLYGKVESKPAFLSSFINRMKEHFSAVVVCWLLKRPSNMLVHLREDLKRQVYVLPH